MAGRGYRPAVHRLPDGRTLSEAARVEEIRALLQAGKEQREIARQMGCSRSTVSGVAFRMRKKAGSARAAVPPDGRVVALPSASDPEARRARKPGRKPMPESVRQGIIDGVREGATATAMAERYKVSPSTAQEVVALARAAGELPPARTAPPVISDEVRRDVVRRLGAGERLQEVAAAHGLSLTNVKTIRKNARAAGELASHTGVPVDPAERAALVEQVLALGRQGLETRAVAARFKVSPEWVALVFRSAGIQRPARAAVVAAVPWTRAECEVLRREAPNGIAAVMAALAPHRPAQFHAARTHSQINRQANLMGIVIAASGPEMAPEGAGVLFDDLAPHGCRWPLGVGPDGQERFCGAPRDASATGGRARYCAAHGARATVKAATHREAKQLAGAGW